MTVDRREVRRRARTFSLSVVQRAAAPALLIAFVAGPFVAGATMAVAASGDLGLVVAALCGLILVAAGVVLLPPFARVIAASERDVLASGRARLRRARVREAEASRFPVGFGQATEAVPDALVVEGRLEALARDRVRAEDALASARARVRRADTASSYLLAYRTWLATVTAGTVSVGSHRVLEDLVAVRTPDVLGIGMLVAATVTVLVAVLDNRRWRARLGPDHAAVIETGIRQTSRMLAAPAAPGPPTVLGPRLMAIVGAYAVFGLLALFALMGALARVSVFETAPLPTPPSSAAWTAVGAFVALAVLVANPGSSAFPAGRPGAPWWEFRIRLSARILRLLRATRRSAGAAVPLLTGLGIVALSSGELVVPGVLALLVALMLLTMYVGIDPGAGEVLPCERSPVLDVNDAIRQRLVLMQRTVAAVAAVVLVAGGVVS